MKNLAKIVLRIALACTFAVPALTFAGKPPKVKHAVQQLMKTQQQGKKILIRRHRFEKEILRKQHQAARKQLHKSLKQQKQSYKHLSLHKKPFDLW